MPMDYANKDVVIDDFIGRKEGREIIEKFIRDCFPGALIPLDLGFIQKSVIKKLGKKQYDLMIFVETGGVYFLAIPEIMKHAREFATIPASGHENPLSKNIRNLVFQLKGLIVPSKIIAIVEGDVGASHYSCDKLMKIKHFIGELNKDADIDIIVGVAAAEMADRFDMVGVSVRGVLKLSDAARELEENIKSPSGNIERRLLALWQRRKTLPVLVKK